MEKIIDVIFKMNIVCWIITFIQHLRLFYLFRKKYPEVAKKHIPNAFEPYANPEKILFFFRDNNFKLLHKDNEIWRLRQQTKLLLMISFGLLIILLVLLLIIMMA